MQSIVKELDRVEFPEHTMERVYMVPFAQKKGLPEWLKRWQTTVDMMLDGIEVESPIYIMVDQGFVKAGNSHRRGGLHVDGNWIAEIQDHGGHPPTHLHAGKWDESGGRWNHTYKPETIMLASDVSACVGYVGEFEGPIGSKGECTEISTDSLIRLPFAVNRCYAGNVTMLHESVPVEMDCLRTVVRLSIPGLICW